MKEMCANIYGKCHCFSEGINIDNFILVIADKVHYKVWHDYN